MGCCSISVRNLSDKTQLKELKGACVVSNYSGKWYGGVVIDISGNGEKCFLLTPKDKEARWLKFYKSITRNNIKAAGFETIDTSNE